jgi:uncharacterized protein (TIGR02118 family)
MARLVAIYGTPKDTAAFDKHYFERHIPLAKKIPGLRKLEVSQGPVVSAIGPAAPHLIATLHFDDLQAIQHAMTTPEGMAAAADAMSLGSVQVLLFEASEV